MNILHDGVSKFPVISKCAATVAPMGNVVYRLIILLGFNWEKENNDIKN